MIITPKLNISDSFEIMPFSMYSGGMYPLHDNMTARVTIQTKHNLLEKNRAVDFLRALSYNDPIKFIVQVRVFSSPKSLDRPKSAILGTMFLSSKILLGFRSK